MCVRERERERGCVCVCERERERESVCVCGGRAGGGGGGTSFMPQCQHHHQLVHSVLSFRCGSGSPTAARIDTQTSLHQLHSM